MPNPVKHANYDITVSQTGKEVFSQTGIYDAEGSKEFWTQDLLTDALDHERAVNVEIKFLGYGATPPFTGQQDIASLVSRGPGSMCADDLLSYTISWGSQQKFSSKKL